jgi:cytochrome c-type biogenesis protein
MSGGVTHLVLSGPVLLAIPVAAAAGALTFLSPCCLPLVPGYLSYVTGMSGTSVQAGQEDQAAAPTASARRAGPATAVSNTAGAAAAPGAVTVADRAAAAGPGTAIPGTASTGTASPGSVSTGTASGNAGRRAGTSGAARGRVMLGTFLFVLGFSVLFALEGVTVSSIGDALLKNSTVITKVLGCLVIVLGLLFMGAFDRFSFAGRIFRPSFRPRAGLAGAPLLGVMFGLSWTPCIGPTLTAVLALGANSGTAFRGGLLAFIYGLGLGIPFLIVAFAFNRGVNLFGFARRHARMITRIGGLLLITVGVLEVTGVWASAAIWLKVHWPGGYTSPL